MGSTSPDTSPRTWERTLGATRESIAEAGEELAAWLHAERIGETAALLARLALEELATNAATHGGGARVVRVECRATPEELLVVVEDDGLAFDPRLAPSPDLDVPPEDRSPGGLGIHLLRELSDRFDYERSDGRNRVTLARRLGD